MNLLKLELTFACSTPHEAECLERALSADNKSVPKDQAFSCRLEGPVLVFSISSPRASGCISSALGLLTDARLFQDVWTLTTA